MAISKAEFEAANRAGQERRDRDPFACAAVYDAARHRIVITLNTGAEFAFPPEQAEGLDKAGAEDLSNVVISPSGYGISFPALNADFDLTALMVGIFGSRRWMAAALGAKGGKSSTEAKRDAARSNGKLGGRPPKGERTLATAAKRKGPIRA